MRTALIALKAIRYDGKARDCGERFTVPSAEAKLLIVIGYARLETADVPRETADATPVTDEVTPKPKRRYRRRDMTPSE